MKTFKVYCQRVIEVEAEDEDGAYAEVHPELHDGESVLSIVEQKDG